MQLRTSDWERCIARWDRTDDAKRETDLYKEYRDLKEKLRAVYIGSC